MHCLPRELIELIISHVSWDVDYRSCKRVLQTATTRIESLTETAIRAPHGVKMVGLRARCFFFGRRVCFVPLSMHAAIHSILHSAPPLQMLYRCTW
jgi:hypothetical protein